jgi:methylenetetrahydrofolate dehydrogenase (NADP+)/methenyltetrahydrofolate cyclohydrolase
MTQTTAAINKEEHTMAKLIDGKAVSQKIKEEVRDEIEREGLKVGLAVIIVGNDQASRVYVNNKKKACEACGILSFEYALPEETTEKELRDLIRTLNDDPKVNGILVQLPLPKHISEKKIIKTISPKKDVDAFHAENVGRIVVGNYAFLPCTPAGVIELIHSTGTDVSGKECVVIGRSNIVGKPMAMLLLHENGTVTICHSHTKDLAEVCRRADILVSAVGKADFVTADMVKDGAIVIDVGMNRNAENKLCGDVKFDEVEPKASYITPVPGGVGPMTIAMLMKNTLMAKRLQS